MNLKKLFGAVLTLVVGLSFISPVHAANPVSLTVSNTSGDTVQMRVVGDASSSIQLSFLPPGASNLTTVNFGTTDVSGVFSSSISSGGYGIPAGSPVFVSINGVQSGTQLWPSYTSSLALSQTSAQLSVGQSITIGASNTLVLASNSFASGLRATVSGSQLSITRLASGAGTIIVCATNMGCASVGVDVGSQTQTQVSLSQTTLSFSSLQTQQVYISGGTKNGFVVKSNSNRSIVEATISGTSNVLSVYAGNTAGSASVVVCSVESTSNCATLTVNVSNISSALSFSQNNVLLNQGQTQAISITGGTGNNYFVFSNSNPAVVTPTIVGGSVNLVASNTAGSAFITICSTAANNICGSMNVVVNATSGIPSNTALSFSQNVVSLPQGTNVNITVTGGSGSGYVVSSNSSPSVVTASIPNSTSHTVTLYGSLVGSSVVSICSTGSTSVCASIFVTVTNPVTQLLLSQNNVVLSAGGSTLVAVSGGDAANVISSNSNTNVVSASLMSSGKIIVLTAKNISGSASIVVCPSTNTNCTTLSVTVNAAAPAPVVTPVVPAPVMNTPAPVIAPAPTFHFVSLLKLGSTGQEVRELQQTLKNLGYYTHPSITGYFGPATKTALIKFQKAKGLKPFPGWVGPSTRDALNAVR